MAPLRARSELVRRNRIWLAFGASPWFIALGLALMAVLTGVYALLILLFHLAIAGGLGLAWAYKHNSDPRHVPCEVVADRSGLSLDGALVARREEILGGYVVPHEGSTHLRLERRGLRPTLSLRVEDPQQGRAILHALGLDATQAVAEMRASSGLLALPLVTQLAVLLGPMFGVLIPSVMLTGLLASPIPAVGGVLLVLAYVFGVLLSPTTVRVGVDGVLVRWLRRERFVPFSSLDRAEAYAESVGGKEYVGVALQLRSGERIKIITGQSGWTGSENVQLAQRIGDALAAHRTGGAHADAAVLGRAGRSPADWVAALRRLGAGADADLRRSPTSIESLLALVQDTEAPPVTRASAAVATLQAASPEDRERIRIAAETTVEPRLRIALEQVTREGASDDEIGQTLAELEADAAAPARR